jgi:hypothetical protein
MGVSLNPGPPPTGPDPGAQARPGRSIPGRRVKAVGFAAGRVPKRLDRRRRASVGSAASIEIFFRRRPASVGVGPAGRTWSLGHKADDRQGATWHRHLRMPPHHRDPFDRLLIAQAMVEQVPILGADTAFDAYPVTRLW